MKRITTFLVCVLLAITSDAQCVNCNPIQMSSPILTDSVSVMDHGWPVISQSCCQPSFSLKSSPVEYLTVNETITIPRTYRIRTVVEEVNPVYQGRRFRLFPRRQSRVAAFNFGCFAEALAAGAQAYQNCASQVTMSNVRMGPFQRLRLRMALRRGY